jgi:hypothetical protein
MKSKICNRTKSAMYKGRQATGLISQSIDHRRTMSKEIKLLHKQWQPATEALEKAKHFRQLAPLRWDKFAPEQSSALLSSLKSSSSSSSSSSQSSASKSTIDMSSIFQETNAIHLEAFQFPDIAWAFDQDDEEATGFSQSSLTNNTNPDDPDMSTVLNPTFTLKRMRRNDSEHPAGMVRSRALYSNLFQLGLASGSFSPLSPPWSK